jgi:hypothetical protein
VASSSGASSTAEEASTCTAARRLALAAAAAGGAARNETRAGVEGEEGLLRQQRRWREWVAAREEMVVAIGAAGEVGGRARNEETERGEAGKNVIRIPVWFRCVQIKRPWSCRRMYCISGCFGSARRVLQNTTTYP